MSVWPSLRIHALTDGGEDFRTKTWRTTAVNQHSVQTWSARPANAATMGAAVDLALGQRAAPGGLGWTPVMMNRCSAKRPSGWWSK
jgi:hypothetical protein